MSVGTLFRIARSPKTVMLQNRIGVEVEVFDEVGIDGMSALFSRVPLSESKIIRGRCSSVGITIWGRSWGGSEEKRSISSRREVWRETMRILVNGSIVVVMVVAVEFVSVVVLVPKVSVLVLVDDVLLWVEVSFRREFLMELALSLLSLSLWSNPWIRYKLENLCHEIRSYFASFVAGLLSKYIAFQ